MAKHTVVRIDKPHPRNELEQFAGELRKVEGETLQTLAGKVVGDQPPEFYAGMICGLTAALSMMQTRGVPEAIKQNFLVALAAKCADTLLRKG